MRLSSQLRFHGICAQKPIRRDCSIEYYNSLTRVSCLEPSALLKVYLLYVELMMESEAFSIIPTPQIRRRHHNRIQIIIE